jgi:hypothetical protein
MSNERSWLRPAFVLLVLSHETPVPMRSGAWQSGAEFTLLSRRGATGGTPNRQGSFMLGFHVNTMRRGTLAGCPIVDRLGEAVVVRIALPACLKVDTVLGC